MIDSIGGSGGAPPVYSSKVGATETTQKGSAPDASGAKDVSRQQEPDDSRVSAVEVTQKVANDAAQNAQVESKLGIYRNDEVERYVYKGVNQTTKEVERQWPTEEALRQMAVFREMMGRVLDETG